MTKGIERAVVAAATTGLLLLVPGCAPKPDSSPTTGPRPTTSTPDTRSATSGDGADPNDSCPIVIVYRPNIHGQGGGLVPMRDIGCEVNRRGGINVAPTPSTGTR